MKVYYAYNCQHGFFFATNEKKLPYLENIHIILDSKHNINLLNEHPCFIEEDYKREIEIIHCDMSTEGIYQEVNHHRSLQVMDA